ncbi:MAG: hypothetical protein HZB51_15060 [Chloroflexi bacterium]|nr:hypothetical protein [Chloroflexota bacterium]
MDSIKTKVAVAERRAKPRVECGFSALVRGYGKDGKKFQEPATVCNLSACGLYMRVHKAIEPGSQLFVVIYLSEIAPKETASARIAIRGPVVRALLKPNGDCDLAIEFNRNRFL